MSGRFLAFMLLVMDCQTLVMDPKQDFKEDQIYTLSG